MTLAKDPQFAIGIDAGSHRTRCVIAILEDDEGWLKR